MFLAHRGSIKNKTQITMTNIVNFNLIFRPLVHFCINSVVIICNGHLKTMLASIRNVKLV